MNYHHQQKIIDANPKKIGLFLGTGAGKTRIALQLARGRTLVVCTKTIFEDRIWDREREKLKLTEAPVRLMVMSKEKFKKTWQDLPHFDTLIGDEAHKLAGIQAATFQRNYKKYPRTSQIYDAMLGYVQKHNPERVYLLTATPIPKPMVVYGLAQILGYKWDFFEFRNDFYFEKSRNIWLVRKSKAVKERLARIVNHIGEVGRLQDWYDVPDQTYKTHDVGVTKEQVEALPELQLLYPDPLVQLGKRHQLEQGHFEGMSVLENKTDAIRQYVNEFGKVIVFARYTAQIERYCRELGITHQNVFSLTGKTTNRGQLLEKVNSLDEYILIVQSSISEGWEVPDCPCVIFASESFSYTDREQAEGRILRVKKLKKNLYVTLIAGEVDKKVRDNISNKHDFVEHMHAENICKNKKLV